MSKPTGNPRGRPKGAKSKHTLEREQQLAETAAKAEQALGPGAFDGDAHALLVLTYKNTEIPLAVRLDAAGKAIPYEKPKLAAIELNADIRRSVDDLTDEELIAIAGDDPGEDGADET